MATHAVDSVQEAPLRPSSRFNEKPHAALKYAFLAILAGGFLYAVTSIIAETRSVGETLTTGVLAFLVLALFIALVFEFVNGFHDTANAVATVIYTNSMKPLTAVIWSGAWNFLGVIVSTGAVAYTVISLLPVDLILNVGSAAGFAMIFALLVAAVLWNLATWYVGLPNSSSHALIGSIMGVGIANQLIAAGSKTGTSGVDWAQAQKVFSALLFSPMMGFVGALVLMWVLRMFFSRNSKLFTAPQVSDKPPRGIRAILIFTCTAVSFAHGGNDGQKGMGLIMLILIGCAPTAYALNRTMTVDQSAVFVQHAQQVSDVFSTEASGIQLKLPDARRTLSDALQVKKADLPQVYAALSTVSASMGQQVAQYGSMAKVPSEATRAVRNDMYLVLDTSRLITKSPDVGRKFSGAEVATITSFQSDLESGTRYIPLWVKVVVAIALGLGTMVGWKRIVVTIGERIGKTEFTYSMGASAELIAASTILLAERYGAPVSTTHILTSGVAGAAVGQGAGLQFGTIRNIVLAWVLTLPAAMALSGGLYWLMLSVIGVQGVL